MQPFTKAFETIAGVMRDGAISHPDNDWVRQSPEYRIGRAEQHLRLLREGDQRQDHLSQATNAPAHGATMCSSSACGAA